MATKKKLLQAAAGTAAASGGAGGLNVEQVFSTYLYEGNGSALAIENGIALGDQYDGGSAKFTDGNDGWPIELDTTLNLTGDFTFEVFINLNSTFSPSNVMAGSDLSVTNDQIAINSSGIISTYSDDNGGTIVTSTSGITLGTWHHIAISRSGSTMYFFIDGVAAGTGTTSYTFSLKAIGALGNYTGNASVKGYMSNLRISNNARYTSAFTAPTSDLSADANTLLLALQGTDPFTDQSGNYTLTVSNTVKASTFGPYYADAGDGGLVWLKDRTSASHANLLYDTNRGVNKAVLSDGTSAELTRTSGLTSFNANGFTVGSQPAENNSGSDFTSWTFRKAPKFFDVVTYTGTGSVQNISHDLGAVPAAIFVKQTSGSTRDWNVYHRGVNGGSNPEGYYLRLQGTEAAAANVNKWDDTAPTDTVFTVGTAGSTNGSGDTYVAYLFAHNDGDGDFGPTGDQDIIKCGSYSGSTTVDLGFEPQWILRKRTDSTGNWALLDTMRGWGPFSSTHEFDYLLANTSGAEATSYGQVPTATGFTTSSTGDYIYIAIRRGPMAVPTDATDVFAVVDNDNGNQTQPLFRTGFVTDMTIEKQTSGGSGYIFSRLTGQAYMNPDATSAEGTGSAISWDYMDGMGESASGNWYAWNWQRRPNFFDIVAYTGDGVAGRTVSHNLGVAPEMMWVKLRDGTLDWAVYHKDLYNGRLWLNDTNAYTASSMWNNTLAGADSFTVGSTSNTNLSGRPFIAYLFASLDGVSKVGSVSHTSGTPTNVDCGFSAGARFIILKRYDATSNWWVFDTERGIAVGNDARLYLDTTNAETSTDQIDPYSAGFTIDGNRATGDYIFYAVS